MQEAYKPNRLELIEARMAGTDQWFPATFHGWHRKTYPIVAWQADGHVEIKQSCWDIRPAANS